MHIRTVLTKIVKDIIVRYKTMQGFRTPYVPGWDCHGLPIEHQVVKESVKEKKASMPCYCARPARNIPKIYQNTMSPI
jgi:isoleucyl-tRNA synthetase